MSEEVVNKPETPEQAFKKKVDQFAIKKELALKSWDVVNNKPVGREFNPASINSLGERSADYMKDYLMYEEVKGLQDEAKKLKLNLSGVLTASNETKPPKTELQEWEIAAFKADVTDFAKRTADLSFLTTAQKDERDQLKARGERMNQNFEDILFKAQGEIEMRKSQALARDKAA